MGASGFVVVVVAGLVRRVEAHVDGQSGCQRSAMSGEATLGRSQRTAAAAALRALAVMRATAGVVGADSEDDADVEEHVDESSEDEATNRGSSTERTRRGPF